MDLYDWYYYYYIDTVPEWLRNVQRPPPVSSILMNYAMYTLFIVFIYAIYYIFWRAGWVRIRILREAREKILNFGDVIADHWITRKIITYYDLQPEEEDIQYGENYFDQHVD